MNLKGRNFLTLKDFTPEEIIYLLEGRLKVRFGDGGERQIGADELLVINSGTIHAVTAYPNQAIVLQVPYEMLLQYMEHYDQLYFVVDERPASEEEKQKLAEFKAVLREMDEVYGAQKEGYQLKFDSLLLEALYRLLVDYAVRIGKEHIPQNQKAVQQIREVMQPIARMDGDSLPVSSFVANANGEWEQGASAYEKRGTAVNVPEWDASKCVGCNQCAFVCSHATIRPFQLTADELAAAPAQTKSRDNKLTPEYKFVMAVSPLDCMGCGECVTVCPTKAITMVPQDSQADQQAVFDYCVANISKKATKMADDTVMGSQFNQPLLEFSGSCAGCAETSYARLITQLFGEKMYISNATGCSSIWGGTASISPYTVNKDSGHGPAWCNSLFEDNAEHGLGLYIGQKTIRENLIKEIAEVAGSDKASAELKAAYEKFIATKNNTKANDEPAKALIAELEKAAAAGCTESAEILKSKEFIAKKSVWIFGGDGWAYDIGFGGLDHVLASGEDVNVMVFDTEMYSNTGGQASKASNIGEVCQFAAAGKEISKKSLSEIAMTYGYIYVAQIALGANMAQAVKVIAEAEAYPGPSLIIGYAPCELHGVKGGMTNCQNEMKKAVEAGYWNLFTFNPANKAQGKNPFTLTSKAVDNEKYQALLANETRYSRLTRAFPERAKALFARNEQVANDRYEHLTRLVELYK